MKWARIHANNVARSLRIVTKELVASTVKLLEEDRYPFLTRKTSKHSELHQYVADEADGEANLLVISKAVASKSFKVLSSGIDQLINVR